jgi:hypothetical protein
MGKSSFLAILLRHTEYACYNGSAPAGFTLVESGNNQIRVNPLFLATVRRAKLFLGFGHHL